MPTDFDKLWDYSKPDETEKKFRQLLSEAERANDPSYLAQLLTQIARTQGLQNRFDEAHATLDRVEKMLTDDLKLARIRYLLERGRVFNSSGKPDRAMPLFVQASELAIAEKENRYAIDAIHMIAIAEPDPQKQVEWNLKGIAMAQADPKQRGWLFSLYNNIAESYALLKDYQSALSYINKTYGPARNYLSVLAVAPYVGVQQYIDSIDDESLTLDGLFDSMSTFLDETLPPLIRQNYSAALATGLTLMAYEGGQSLTGLNDSNEALKEAAQDDPRMGDLYKKLIRTWYDNSGGGAFVSYALASPRSAYGSWGLLQGIDETGSVKWDAVMSTILR